MFSLFAKKEMDRPAAEQFWQWFTESEEWIISTYKANGMAVIEAVDARLKPVFPYFKQELEFQLGFNSGKGEFFFFHLGNKYLIRDGEILKSMMPASLAERWVWICEK